MAYNRRATLGRLQNAGIKDEGLQKVFFKLADGHEVLVIQTELTVENGLTEKLLIEVKKDKFVLTPKGRDMICGRPTRRRATKLQKYLAWSMNND